MDRFCPHCGEREKTGKSDKEYYEDFLCRLKSRTDPYVFLSDGLSGRLIGLLYDAVNELGGKIILDWESKYLGRGIMCKFRGLHTENKKEE